VRRQIANPRQLHPTQVAAHAQVYASFVHGQDPGASLVGSVREPPRAVYLVKAYGLAWGRDGAHRTGCRIRFGAWNSSP
jgi:hypothetical protein